MPPKRSSAKLKPADELAYDGLDELVGFHLRRAQGAVHRDFLSTLGEVDLTQKQTATLWLIGANPSVSQVQIATELDMDRATMMALVDRLEARGLVLRRRSEADRRRQELCLTPRGQSVLKAAKRRIEEHERSLKRRLSAAELRTFCALLRRLYE